MRIALAFLAATVIGGCVNGVDDGAEIDVDEVVNPGGDEQALTMPACGTVLATFEGVSAKSNASHTGTGVSCAGQGGVANGLQYQCVELVMRFFKTKWNLRWYGNAKDLLNGAPRSEVDVYNNGDHNHPPVPGDMLVWTNGNWGHTALVTSVTSSHVHIIEQNVPGDGTASLPYDGSTIGARWNGWVPKGWAHAKANHIAASAPPPSAPPPSSSSGCNALGVTGGVIDNENGCFTPGGTSSYLHASTEGYSSSLVWTMTTNAAARDNFAKWNVHPARAGKYRIDAFTDTTVAMSKDAKYAIVHDGSTSHATIDQSAHNGFRSLGTFTFAAGSGQRVELDDNTGEAGSLRRKLVFDAIRVVPACSTLHVETVGATLNVRSSPSTSAAIEGHLDAGAVVTRLDTVDGTSVDGNTIWHKVQKGSVTGFATGKYLACPP